VKAFGSTLAAVCLVLLVSCSGLPKTGTNSGSGSGSGTSGTATLTSIDVTPASTSVAVNATQPFTATAHYSDSTTKDVTAFAQWASSNTAIASVSATGTAKGLKTGSATITATIASIHGSANLTVIAAGASLTAIAILPQTSSVPVNSTQQFSATGTYSDGSSRDITSLVTWASSTNAVANIDVNGLLAALAAGSTTISATLNGVTQSLLITVTTPAISSISVSPVGLTLAIGINQQYVVTAFYTDGSSADLQSGAVWSSSSPAVATINAGTGSATTVGPGTTTITATVGSFTDTSSLTVVDAHLQSLSLIPATATLAIGTTVQFSATGIFDDGSTQLLPSVAWSSSAQNLLTVNSSGLATGIAAGSITVTASSGGISGTAALTVTSATLVSLSVTPANSTMPIGATKQFTATGTFSDATTQDITVSALWTSSTAATATINNQGLVTSVATGTTKIAASFGSVSGSTNLIVSTAKLASITVTPASAQIAAGTSLKFTATGTFSDGSVATTLSSVAWKSSKPQFASIRSSGLAHGKKAGTVTITATSSGVSGTATLIVGTGTLVSVAISPANPSVSVGSTQQFTATGTFSDTSTQDITLNTHWSSSVSNVATIANAPSEGGLATTTGIGVTTIGANSHGIQAATSLTAH
jgi:uncharacterized protein YjdB